MLVCATGGLVCNRVKLWVHIFFLESIKDCPLLWMTVKFRMSVTHTCYMGARNQMLILSTCLEFYIPVQYSSAVDFLMCATVYFRPDLSYG